jgi:hypothetical protein
LFLLSPICAQPEARPSKVSCWRRRLLYPTRRAGASALELLGKQVSGYDESELCKLLLEITLLDSAYQRSTTSRHDVLMDTAKRYRVDTEKLQKAVSAELGAKRGKKTKTTAKPKDRKTAA